ncbi:hypothetical protein QF038_000871 [Pseudarthrobacter sp. W1I19]|uniref:hypothetical protein n=1 Tax=Pseudarthrobacter sp. W1I19 TaxID=3042288 RepID=UPI002784651C|nr:hypothetical protein [Pseudarthrobacter sp. W1I19]MDQ0922363.1 hypothetical protein [Pseudarthrobacter sp. W1I19]
MASTGRVVVESIDELASGDGIEAFHKDTLVHRGPVTDTMPECGLFWILDTVTGGRRLLDMSDLEIFRLPSPTDEPSFPGFFRGSHRPEGATGATSYWRDASALD